jgi:hypothetical protein
VVGGFVVGGAIWRGVSLGGGVHVVRQLLDLQLHCHSAVKVPFAPHLEQLLGTGYFIRIRT